MDLIIEQAFPEINNGEGYELTSLETPEYNCIAWSVRDTTKPWWPGKYGFYWPPNILNTNTISAFKEMYETFGFIECDTTELEPGFEKVALFVDPNTDEPKHATRQLEDGRWTSKLGSYKDISHDLMGVVSPVYGVPRLTMKRLVGLIV